MAKRMTLIAVSTLLVLDIALWEHTSHAASLNEIIEGAKKEGTVSAKLRSGLPSGSITRLSKEIKDKYGVDMNIMFTPSDSQPKDLADSIMESKMGSVPTYDVNTFGAENVLPGLKAGIIEKVNWSDLLPKDVSRDVVVNLPPYGEIGLSYYSSFSGLMYNPKRLSASEVPRTLSDFASPKWKGKLVGIANYPDVWAARAFIGGKDKVLSNIRAILENGAVQGKYVDLYNRYLIGEIYISFVSDGYFRTANIQGMPAVWQNLDFSIESKRPLVLRKGARHPNSAKLLAIYLASEQGAKFMQEESGVGNASYPGYSQEIANQAKEQGMQVLSMERVPKLLDFYNSNEGDTWMKEIDLLFKTVKAR